MALRWPREPLARQVAGSELIARTGEQRHRDKGPARLVLADSVPAHGGRRSMFVLGFKIVEEREYRSTTWPLAAR